MRRLITACLITFGLVGRAFAQESGTKPAEPAIEDNSFFIEEAYNQEAGVVQHINTAAFSGPGHRDIGYSFTQEWPVGSQRHQASFTLPYSRVASAGVRGIGDILLNYRYQITAPSAPVAFAPRLSAVLPTGSVNRGLGNGSVGFQVNFPVSWRMNSLVVTHWNAGATVLPRAQAPLLAGGRVHGTLTSYNLGASVIAPVTLPVQVMLEYVANFTQGIESNGSTSRSTQTILSPGARVALNFGALQVVPGVAFPFTREAGRTSHDLFFYLSFEHPFKARPTTE